VLFIFVVLVVFVFVILVVIFIFILVCGACGAGGTIEDLEVPIIFVVLLLAIAPILLW